MNRNTGHEGALDITRRAIHYLSQSRLFQGVSVETLELLDPPPEIIFLKAGDTLIRKGEENADYFVLVSGRLHAFDEQDGKLIPLGVIRPGDGVGEISLLTKEPRSATVVARLDSEVIRFPYLSFLDLATSQPLTLLQIARTAIQRALNRKTPTNIGEYRTIGLVPMTPDIDIDCLARGLAQELQTHGRTDVVDSAFAGDLNELEQSLDFLIYKTGSRADDWSRSCLLRADLVLLVASVPGPADPGEIERNILQNLDRNIVG
ncbi:MAG TPA: cyclic nucleotide-binding domain-containing protein, partial [Bryobacteraceae bacterium]|nr:cyclic nucleotide-binding domain-containing protein [Bryobacteraceae bacterium]